VAVWKSVGGNVVVGYLGFCYFVGLRLEGNVVKGIITRRFVSCLGSIP